MCCTLLMWVPMSESCLCKFALVASMFVSLTQRLKPKEKFPKQIAISASVSAYFIRSMHAAPRHTANRKCFGLSTYPLLRPAPRPSTPLCLIRGMLHNCGCTAAASPAPAPAPLVRLVDGTPPHPSHISALWSPPAPICRQGGDRQLHPLKPLAQPSAVAWRRSADPSPPAPNKGSRRASPATARQQQTRHRCVQQHAQAQQPGLLDS